MVPEFAQQLLSESPFYQGTMVLIVSLLLSRIAPLPRNFQPIVWFGYLARELASKVNKPNRAASQQIIAGTLAAILLILPFWLIIYFLLQLAAFPWFFEFVILYTCLNDDNFKQVAAEVRQSLNSADKERARSLLTPWLYRDTKQLSSVGISKATIEKLVTSPVYGTVATIVFFGIGGAPLVLACRMIKKLELCWPPINPKFNHFGKPVYWLSASLFLVPSWLWNFSLAIQGGPKTVLMLFNPLPNKGASYNCLNTCAIAASTLHIELGGPMKFNNQRVDAPRLVYGPKPDSHSISTAIKLASTGYTIWLSFIVLVPILWASLRYMQT
ncbi:cobalamin biosynthesis protein [Shewanella eurypsychrophilus]|uniref:Cobalamin biosynthesis protein n=1 Tax=Shewanella eurypsychrophilus TaxID=2593656 RepID=A0ABX6V8Z4_9GAMM|nr:MULTISPECIES: cobalamin biosynthesis protein [Shewanella]QFU21671.1 cobalamin biosynthesis protein CbiB [Shewanella sp. YLB-09]QPG56961.1 cobalamin biosynthesis protein [Shewanella eurypsychrophilus]